MKFGVPWSVGGLRPEAREAAREAARRSGLSPEEWLNNVIINSAEQDGLVAEEPRDQADAVAVNARVDELARRLDRLTAASPLAYAPPHTRGNFTPPPNGAAQFAPPGATPAGPALDRAIAEIFARQRVLDGADVPLAPAAPFPPSAAASRAPQPDLSGLEQQLRTITGQIETLRQPGVENAINALRTELAEIGRTVNEAMPRRAIEAIEREIQGLAQRIAEGRQSGVDAGALAGVERALDEVRDTLRALMPAENLTGLNEAVNGLAQKIDFIVAERDPSSLHQLEHAVNAVREIAANVASDQTIGRLASDVHALAGRVEELASQNVAGHAIANLEQRVSALSEALAHRSQNGGSVPPMLESLVQSLSDKIEQLHLSRGDNVAIGHLEDRIVRLVEKLDASDSRLGHLEAIERGLADLLVHVEDMRAQKASGGIRADDAGQPVVESLKRDIAHTQDSLEAVHGTLGHLVDRLAMIEQNIRGAPASMPPTPRQAPPPSRPAPAAAQASNPPAEPARPVPARGSTPIDPNLPPDQPLEPGAGRRNGSAAARIADSEVALAGGKPPVIPDPGKSDFIAAARRAAQLASQQPDPRKTVAGEKPEAHFAPDKKASGGGMLAKRLRQLVVAASVIAIVVGGLHIIASMVKKPEQATEPASTTGKGSSDITNSTKRKVASREAASAAKDTATGPLNVTVPAAAVRSVPLADGSPLIGGNDITGSVSHSEPSLKTMLPGAKTFPPLLPPSTTGPATSSMPDKLPISIGGALLRDAAMNGDAAAAFEIGVRYAEGRNVPQAYDQASRWFERAATQGLAPAQFRLASLYEKGLGGKKDLKEARRLYIAAAEQGNGKAMHNLAVLYTEGIDGKPDYAMASEWFRKAADRGVSDSQYNLAILYARGLGVEKNFSESYKWFSIAAAHGDRESAKKRDEIAGRLDPAAMTAAREAIKNWTAQAQPDTAVNVPVPPGGWDRAATSPAAPSSKKTSSSAVRVGVR